MPGFQNQTEMECVVSQKMVYLEEANDPFPFLCVSEKTPKNQRIRVHMKHCMHIWINE
jgi:hypothetical protein